MKIHQLPMNARFEYEGQEYVKTGPQLASGKAGQRLIPKYAVLSVIGAEAPAAAKRAHAVEKAEVRKAFETFCACCSPLISADRQPEMQAACEAFLQSLDLASGD